MNLVTIYIPTFKRPRSLELCLKRLLARTNFPLHQLEFIIVDGDNNEKIEKISRDNIESLGITNYIYQKTTDFKASTDFNRAIERASGMFLLRLEDDQFCIAKNKNWLKDAIKLLARFDEITLIGGEGFEHYGGLSIYDHHIFIKNVTYNYVKTLELDGIRAHLLPKDNLKLWPLWQVPFSHGTNIVRKKIWDLIGKYLDQKNQNECESWLQRQFVNVDSFENRQNARLYNSYRYKAHLDEPFALHGIQLFHGPELVHGNGFPTGISHHQHETGDIPSYIDINSDYCLGKDTWLGQWHNGQILDFSPYIDKTGKLVTKDNFDKYGNPVKEVVYSTETIGSITDKLVIENIKIYRLRDKLENDKSLTEEEKTELFNTIEMLDNQRNQLYNMLDKMAEDWFDGKQVPRAFKRLKV